MPNIFLVFAKLLLGKIGAIFAAAIFEWFWEIEIVHKETSIPWYRESICVCAPDMGCLTQSLYKSFLWDMVSHWILSSLFWLGGLASKPQGSYCLYTLDTVNWIRMVPTDSYIWISINQGMGLFERIRKRKCVLVGRGVALLEEVHL